MQSYWFLDHLIDVLIAGEHTGGRFSLVEGCQMPLHVHHDLDEGWYVIEDELTLWVGEDTVHVLGPTPYADRPPGAPHTIKATGAEDRTPSSPVCRRALTSTCAHLRDARVRARPAGARQPPDVARATELALAEDGQRARPAARGALAAGS
jgi:hypothetical protein